MCDCGHQACFHARHQGFAPQDASSTNSGVTQASLAALAERVRKLEEALQQERAIREAMVADERSARDREIRILREALHPFYRSEDEMRRKLVEIEDRIEGNFDDHVRLRDRVVTLDDANMSLERRVDTLEETRPKKRRISRQVTKSLSHDTSADDAPQGSLCSSSHGSGPPVRPSPPVISPPSQAPLKFEPEEPRSSGILNLVDFPEPPPLLPAPREVSSRREARSSGFLELSLAERLATKLVPDPAEDTATSRPEQACNLQLPPHTRAPPAYTAPTLAEPCTGAADKSVNVATSEIITDSPKKRKYFEELRPLDVLANLSCASPMV